MPCTSFLCLISGEWRLLGLHDLASSVRRLHPGPTPRDHGASAQGEPGATRTLGLPHDPEGQGMRPGDSTEQRHPCPLPDLLGTPEILRVVFCRSLVNTPYQIKQVFFYIYFKELSFLKIGIGGKKFKKIKINRNRKWSFILYL